MKHRIRSHTLPACAILLAGGRGTRFWPRSRARTPKQLLNIVSDQTMLRETVARIGPIFKTKNIWAVTNVEQAPAIRRELKGVHASHILAEPVGRNTAAAIGLAAIHLANQHDDALMAVLPSDAFVADATGYCTLVKAALELAQEPSNLVVLGVPPTRPETGYGYIERSDTAGVRVLDVDAYSVKRFTEKPALELAKQYVGSGKFFWNAGMFFWRVSTFLEELRAFLPATYQALDALRKTIGTSRYTAALRRIYPRLKNISVDYAIIEPAAQKASSRVFVIPASIGWSDIGSWAAVYELLAPSAGANVSSGPCFTLDAEGNYFWSPKKFVAGLGVRNLIVVDTDDALLICPRDRSQDVGKVVKWLEERKQKKLL